MDFFEHQERAKRRTGLLVFLFLCAVAAIIVAVYGAVAIAFGGAAFDPLVFLAVAGLTVLVVAAGSTYRIVSLSGGGGAAVAQLLGGRQVVHGGADEREQQLCNVVEEMAIAAGIPVPGIYILEDEEGINAFAAGTSLDNAVVAVTRGCLQALTRDELQGVIAHEFSHILNSDMQLNIRLMGVLFGILVIGIIGEVILRGSGRSRVRTSSRSGKGDGAGAVLLFGLLLFLIGYIGVFFGNLIKAAVSRQREFLADAAAVQFTRNPGGIAGALEKIGRGSAVLDAAHASEASHFFFGQGIGARFFGLFDTHPPLAERIRRIRGRAPETAVGAPVAAVQRVAPAAAAGFAGGGTASAAKPRTTVTESVGQPSVDHLHYAQQLLASLPPTLRQAAGEPFGATAVVCTLLLDGDARERDKQFTWLAQQEPPALASAVHNLLPRVRQAGAAARLPLAELAVGALRCLSAAQYESFMRLVQHLAEWDRSLSLFEYALVRVIRQRLLATFVPRRAAPANRSLAGATREAGILLSALARAGSDVPQQVSDAFLRGRQALGMAGTRCTLCAPDACGLGEVDAALDALATVNPEGRRTLLAALAAVALADGELQADELELLRAIAAALDIPVPPLAAAA